MPDFKINISTPFDGSGTKEAGSALKDVANKTEEAGNKSEEAGRKTGRFGLKMGELKKLTRELGHEFPLAAQAFRAFLNPVVAGITLVIGTFVYWKDKISETNKTLDEVGAKAAERMGDMGRAIKEATTEAALQTDAFNAKLKAMSEHQDTLTKQTEAATAAIREQATALIEVRDAQEAAAVAKINAMQKEGKIDAVTAIKLRTDIKASFAKQRDQTQTAAEQAVVAQEEEELKKRVAQGPALFAAAKAAEAAANDPARKGRIKNDPAMRKALEKVAEDADAAVKEQLDKVTEAENAPEQNTYAGDPEGFAITAGPDRQERLQREQDKLKQLQADRDRARRAAEENSRLIREQAEADRAAAETMKRFQDNDNEVQRLQTGIPSEKQSNATKAQARAAVTYYRNDAANSEAAGELAGLPQAPGTKAPYTTTAAALTQQARSVEAGIQKLEAEFVRVLSESGALRERQLQTLLQKLRESMDKDKNLQQQIDQLRGQAATAKTFGS
jgi:hypothetical protein